MLMSIIFRYFHKKKKTWKSDKNPMKIHQVDTPPI